MERGPTTKVGILAHSVGSVDLLNTQCCLARTDVMIGPYEGPMTEEQ